MFYPCNNNSPSPDLEKAASGASGACGHFVVNPAILRTFESKPLHFLPKMKEEEWKEEIEDGSRRIDVV